MIYKLEKLKKKTDREIIDMVNECMERSVKNQTPHMQRFKKYYEMYRSHIAEENIRPHGANLYIPYTFEAIETIAPRLVTSIFNNRPYLTAVPLSSTAVEKARMLELLLDYQAEKYLDPVLFFTMAFKNALMYGTAIVKTTWKFESKTIRVNEYNKDPRLSALKKREVKEEEVVTYDAPHMEIVSLEDFFFDPNSYEIHDGRYCIHRYYEDLDVIKEKVEDGTYTAKKADIEKLSEESSDNGSQAFSAHQRVDGVTGGNTKPDGMVEVLEFWGDDCIIKVAGDVVLLMDYIPFYHGEKPFVKFIDYPVANEFYGIGEIEVIESLQEELNTTRSQRLDNVTMAINNMWKIRKNAGIDIDQLVSRPNGVIEVDEMDDLEPLDIPDITEAGYKEEQIIKDDIDRTTGVNDYARGGSPARRETATTASLLSESANERFKLKIRLLEKTSFKRVGYQLVALNQQYITEETEVRVFDKERPVDENYTDPQTIKLQPQDIAGQFDIIPCGSMSEPLANKELRQTQITQLYSTMGQSEYINQPEFLTAILEAFDFKNVDKLIMSQEQMQPPQMVQPVDPMQQQMPTGQPMPEQDPAMLEQMMQQLEQQSMEEAQMQDPNMMPPQ